jgi:hypothetical protein
MWLAGSMVPVTTKSGVSVNQETAFKVNAVYAAVRLIADSIAMLPMDTFYRAGGERRRSARRGCRVCRRCCSVCRRCRSGNRSDVGAAHAREQQ